MGSEFGCAAVDLLVGSLDGCMEDTAMLTLLMYEFHLSPDLSPPLLCFLREKVDIGNTRREEAVRRAKVKRIG